MHLYIKTVFAQNMVGRGEVDEDLEAETKEECEKYGKVTKCVIFEVSGLFCLSCICKHRNCHLLVLRLICLA